MERRVFALHSLCVRELLAKSCYGRFPQGERVRVIAAWEGGQHVVDGTSNGGWLPFGYFRGRAGSIVSYSTGEVGMGGKAGRQAHFGVVSVVTRKF